VPTPEADASKIRNAMIYGIGLRCEAKRTGELIAKHVNATLGHEYRAHKFEKKMK